MPPVQAHELTGQSFTVELDIGSLVVDFKEKLNGNKRRIASALKGN